MSFDTASYLKSIGLNPATTHGGMLRAASSFVERYERPEDEFYTDDPVAWCEHRGAHLWTRQKEILRAIPEHQKICVPAGNSVGKTHLTAWIVRWWTSEPDSRVVTTANTGYQVKNNTWHEIRKLAAKFGWQPSPKVMQWDLTPHQQAIGLATDKVEAFQGLHAPRLLVIVDEASGDRIDKIYVAIERLASDFDAKVIMFGNLTRRTGIFAEASKGKMGYHVERVTGYEAADYQEAHGRIPGLVDSRKIKEWIGEHGAESDFVRIAVAAKLPTGESAGLFPPKLIDESLEKPGEPSGDWKLGIDVARSGGDETVIVGRRGDRMEILFRKRVKDHMQTFDWLMDWWTDVLQQQEEEEPAVAGDDDEPIPGVDVFNIDATGEGSALADLMARAGMPVRREHFGGAAKKPKRFKNRRAEGFYALRDWMSNGGRIPEDMKLIEELEYIEPFSVIGKQGALVKQLRPKKELKARLGRSPDVSDACMLCVIPNKKGRPNITAR